MCNLMTKQGETDGFKASDFAEAMTRYLSPSNLDWAIVNTAAPTAVVAKAYEGEGAEFVNPDLDEIGKHVKGIIAMSLAANGLPYRHDPDRAATAILQALEAGRVERQLNEGMSST